MTRREENIATAYRGLEAFSRGDFDAAFQDMHPDIEWHVTFRLPDLPLDKDVYRGRDEVMELWRAFSSVWETLTVEIEEVLHADDDRILLRARFHGRGGGSGIEVDRVVYYAYRLMDGRLTYSRAHETVDEARRDLGLPDDA